MPGDEQPPEPLSSADFHKFMESFKTSIGETIHSAIAPVQAVQKEIIVDLTKTKDRVTAIEEDNDSTKAKVDELQKQMSSLQQNLSIRQTPSSSTLHPPVGSNLGYRPSPPPPPPTVAPSPDAAQVLRDAKRVIGFSPIKIEDINYLKEQHSIDDDTTAMTISIIEFLTFEMKVPKSFTDKLVLKRVFPPAKPPPSGWSTLYAEFPDSTSADLVHQYVRNLLPGKTMSIYVPHSLHPRYSAICDIAHEYRNGTLKHKTKIKYGSSDFVLIVKPKNSSASPWSYVPLTGLPPLELSTFDGNPSRSPPPGRTRITSKRDRSESPNAGNENPSKSRKDDEPDEPLKTSGSNDECSEVPPDEAVVLSTDSETSDKPESPAPATKDPGLFQPSACASPSASRNKNFTFGMLQSSIPKMKTHLN